MQYARIATGALALATLCLTSCSAAVVREGAASIPASEWERLAAAEDARAATPSQVRTLRDGLASDNEHVRAMAVRALGRTERTEFAADIAPLLRDDSDRVRVAAAHALGDVSRDTASAWLARALLLEALPARGAGSPDTDAATAAAIAETLGRLRSDSAAALEIVTRIAPFLSTADEARAGAIRGLYFLARLPAARPAVATAADALRSISRTGVNARERGLAITTLAMAGAADELTLIASLRDSTTQVRRAAASAATTLRDTAQLRRLMEAALDDANPIVRYEALVGYARRLSSVYGCVPVARAVRDSAIHVALLALDLIGTVCVSSAHVEMLDSIAGGVRPGANGWQRAAHATVALAAIDRERARPRAQVLARHTIEFPRTYAARAAHAIADTALLYQLAYDPRPNVRTAAVAGLSALVGHDADSVYVEQLASDENELLMTAAAALETSAMPGVAERLFDALDRVTAREWETSRDARVALLVRARELGIAADTTRVLPYLTDFDPHVADLAASMIESWTGVRPATAPKPLPALPLPTHDDVVRLAAAAFIIELEDGSEIEIRLLPFDAPTNAARFARLARNGYYTGLTIHRIAPNFVVQGGSPGANEYNGDGPFTRDEIGVQNRRGTVGLSTRGRDTGDAQFFINLIDNVRLDHEYTVLGMVVRGMAVVDGLREGAVIRHIREEAR